MSSARDPEARPGIVPDDRTPSQVAHERAMTEVSETLMNVEQAIRRTKRAQAEVADGPEPTTLFPDLETPAGRQQRLV